MKPGAAAALEGGGCARVWSGVARGAARGVARAHPRAGRAPARVLAPDENEPHAAKAAAQRRASGKPLGPLDGVPIALKDIFCMEGVETTCGSKILRGYAPPTTRPSCAGSSRPGPSSSAS